MVRNYPPENHLSNLYAVVHFAVHHLCAATNAAIQGRSNAVRPVGPNLLLEVQRKPT